MSAETSTKQGTKRKSMASGSGSSAAMGERLNVVVEQPSTSSAGPVFVNYPSVRPADHIPFTVYSNNATSGLPLAQQSTIISGETPDVLFASHNRSQGGVGTEGSDCQYIPALYDPSSSTLTIHPDTPLYLMSSTVKRLKGPGISTVFADQQERAKQWRKNRDALGETFGTRKAKSQIKAEERNKVDVAAMEGVKGHLLGSITERAVVEAGPPDLIPTPDMETDEPMKVYTRQALIPDDEWTSISVSDIVRAEDDKARMALLPWRRGKWLEGKLRAILHGESNQRKTNLRYLINLSSLHHFLNLSNMLAKLSVTEIQEKSRGISSQVLNGLLTNFAQKSGKRYTITDKMRTKILSWICALSLVLDAGVTEVGRTAGDLNMTDAKIVNIYKSLGCAIDLPTPAEREAGGMSMEAAKKRKRAVLKAPVKFPKPKSRAGPRR